MMDATAILDRLREVGVSIRSDGEDLVLKPTEKIPLDLYEPIKAVKPELMAILVRGISVSCSRCSWSHPECSVCCLPSRVTTRPIEDYPVDMSDVSEVLVRWHSLGHPPIPIGDLRQIEELPFWLVLLTPRRVGDFHLIRAVLATERVLA